MAFESWSDFIQMGGHGLFVWSAYFISIVLMAWLLLRPGFLQKNLLREIERHRHRSHNQPKRERGEG